MTWVYYGWDDSSKQKPTILIAWAVCLHQKPSSIQQNRKRFCSWSQFRQSQIKSWMEDRGILCDGNNIRNKAVCLQFRNLAPNSAETKKFCSWKPVPWNNQIKSWIERTNSYCQRPCTRQLNNTSEISWLGCTMVKDDSSKQKPDESS